MASSSRQEAVPRLVGGPVRPAAPCVPPLAGGGAGALGPHPRQLLHVAGLHLQSLGEGLGLPGAEDVVGGGEPHVDDLEALVAPARVDDLAVNVKVLLVINGH